MNLFKTSTIIFFFLICLQAMHLHTAEQPSIKKSDSDFDWVTEFSDSSPKSTGTVTDKSDSPESVILPEIDRKSIILTCKDYIELCKLDDRLRTDVTLKFENSISPETSGHDFTQASNQKVILNQESTLQVITILSENESLYGGFSYTWKKKILYNEDNLDETSESAIIRLYKKNSTIMKPVLLHYIEKYESSESACFVEGIQNKRIDALQFLIDLGIEINKQYHFGMTPLHVAYMQDNKEIIDLLIGAGADTKTKNIIGIAPDGSCSIS